MIEHYTKMAQKYGDLKARYRNAICLVMDESHIYEAMEEDGMYRVIDDSGEDYLYSMTNPAPLDGSSKGGYWEIIEK